MSVWKFVIEHGKMACYRDGRRISRKKADEYFAARVAGKDGFPLISKDRLWGKPCLAMGCMPEEIKDFQKVDKQHGVSMEYTKFGQIVPQSRQHRARWLKAHGKFDGDGGYGD